MLSLSQSHTFNSFVQTASTKQILPIWADGKRINIGFMRHRLGLRAILIDLMVEVEIKGDEAMIQILAEFSKRNASYVKGIPKLTISLDESRLWILGQYLTQLGLSTESWRSLEDDRRVRYYRLNTEDVAFANPYHQ
ncbi:hypothetical protein N0Y54_14595 [Nostoc punctiforme UO1]|uniref:hypothetical protein n=1 Tax=Nostoc punctiforme TaxID=272131 RepID=UPI003096AB82